MRGLVWGLLGCLAFGCGDDDAGGEVDAGTIEDGGAMDANVRGDAGETVPWEVEVRDLLTGDAVVTAVICVREAPAIPCASVNDEGVATIGLPPNAEVTLETTAIRYYDQLNPLTTGSEPGSIDIDMGKTSNIEPLIRVFGVELEDDRGQLAWLGQSRPGQGVVGLTATVSSGGEGPYFVDPDGVPDPELEATSESGLGVTANLEAGVVTVTYDNPFGGCEAAQEAWASDEANSIRAPIEAGYLTIAIARCDGMPDAGMPDAGPVESDAGAVDAGASDAGADAGPE